MKKVLISCPKCNGKGRSELPPRLRAGYDAIKKLKVATVSEFAKIMGTEVTASHHLVKRLVAAGVIERVPDSAPAKYQVR